MQPTMGSFESQVKDDGFQTRERLVHVGGFMAYCPKFSVDIGQLESLRKQKIPRLSGIRKRFGIYIRYICNHGARPLGVF